VLRAFSTAAWAFELGAERIVLTDNVDDALALKASIPDALALKDSQPLPGFELTNSPILLQEHDLKGLTIVQLTRHGTVGAVAARAAEHLFCASFLTAGATAAVLRALCPSEVCYVITGEEGVAEEDRACAEYIAALVEDPRTDAAPYLDRARHSSTADLLRQRVDSGVPGVHADDLETCLETNRFAFALRATDEDGLLVLRRL
jgi:2-phosphosulfolactate phosphatase